MVDVEKLRGAVRSWAPTYPRRASNANKIQKTVNNEVQMVSSMMAAADGGNPGFYSVYSFPHGHPRDGNIPKVDTIFLDFDIIGTLYEGESREAWENEIEMMLNVIRPVADMIFEEGKEEYWRATLSGHKGIHLYLDIPPVDSRTGELSDFKTGLSEYSEALVEELGDEAGVSLKPFLDVDGSDLARLARMPNTPHHGVGYTDETRWCVPTTLGRLRNLDAEKYEWETSKPRSVPEESNRVENRKARAVITNHVREATPSASDRDYTGRSYDPSRVEKYKENSNENIEQEDFELYFSDKPFVINFAEREDRFNHGAESHYMEMAVLLEMINKNVPIDEMMKFFEDRGPDEDGYDAEYTRQFAEELIARDYSIVSLAKLKNNCPTFYTESLYDKTATS